MKESRNIFPTKTAITKKDRQKLHNHKSFVIWFTGLSGSGKTSIANHLEKKLHSLNLSTFLLDGDHVRTGLNSDLSFTDKDRRENIRRVGEASKLLVDAGIITLSTFISPFANERKMVRELLDQEEFIEVFVSCSLETCEKRDPKGLYKKARSGKIMNFTGISSPYDVPQCPEITVFSDSWSVEKCVDEIMKYLVKFGYVHS